MISQEWKLIDTACANDRCDPSSRHRLRHKNPKQVSQHDGTAQSVLNEETPRERSVRPVVDLQRGAKATAIYHWKR